MTIFYWIADHSGLLIVFSFAFFLVLSWTSIAKEISRSTEGLKTLNLALDRLACEVDQKFKKVKWDIKDTTDLVQNHWLIYKTHTAKLKALEALLEIEFTDEPEPMYRPIERPKKTRKKKEA